MQLTGIDLLLTYRCSGRCAHCCYRGSPLHRETMSEPLFTKIMESLAGQPLRWILLFGGEPLLLGDQLFRWIQIAATRFPDTHISIITNGFWATTLNRTRDIIDKLQKAGLTDLSLSFDTFHAAHVPPENIQQILDILQPEMFRSITVDTHYLHEIDAANKFNDQTSRLVNDLQIPSFVQHHKFTLRIVGRMTDNVEGKQLIHEFAHAECKAPFWVGPSLANPNTVEIDPFGHVTLCPGICIGNLNNAPLTNIIASYNPHKHPIVSALDQAGIDGLLQLAKKHGVLNDTLKVLDPCHACFELRRSLLEIYPDAIAPAHIYTSST